MNRVLPWACAFIPLFFLPVTQDYYDIHKWLLLVLIALFVLPVASWSLYRTSKIHISRSPAAIALGSITIASIISLFVSSTNKIEALLDPMGPGTFAALTLVSLFASDHMRSRKFWWIVVSSAATLALISIYQLAGVATFMFPQIAFLADPLWTPTGSSLATIAIFVILLPAIGKEAFRLKNVILAIMAIAVTIALALTLWHIVPKLRSYMLLPREGWIVMAETLKNPRQAIAGVGAENFVSAFTAGKPVRFNLTPLWTTRFTTNSNLLFHLTTIYGLLGAAATLLFFKMLWSRRHMLSLVALLVVPPNLSLLVIVLGLLLISNDKTGTPIHIPLSRWARGGIFVIMSILTIFGVYVVGRAYIAELTFARSLAAAQAHDGTAAYNLQFQATRQNPAITRFHMAYSQTNLALALALSKEKEISTEDQNLIGELFQQAIREAKLAVSLNPRSILAWEHLARTYQQLIGLANGADTWAVASYTQAILFDPYNPLLSLELGSVHVFMKNYTLAITQFIRATNLKPDFSNAWYNLANAYRLKGDGEEEIKTLEKTLTLIAPTSSDYQTVSQELDTARQSHE